MKITPLDIRQKRFAAALRGLDRREVEAFQELLAAEFEEVVRENIQLKEELKRSQLQLEQHVERERTLQETMVTAQRISEELRSAAKKEADIIVAEAELQAERIVRDAHQRLIGIVSDVNELKRQRAQFEAQVRVVVESHLKLLETFRSANDPLPEPGGIERIERIEDVSFLQAKKAR
jgi:cell division initiation protein